MMSIPADQIRVGLESVIGDFAARTTAALPSGRTSMDSRGTPHFPFRSTVSIAEADPAGDEVVVLSVSLWTDRSGGIYLSSDLSEGDGTILADGPNIRTSLEKLELPALETWIRETAVFIKRVAGQAIQVGKDRGL
jgi:hypothetical protein